MLTKLNKYSFKVSKIYLNRINSELISYLKKIFTLNKVNFSLLEDRVRNYIELKVQEFNFIR